MWLTVQRLQARRMLLRISVAELARRMEASGRPVTRETLSRVLNGKQATSWSTVEHLALLLDVGLDEIPSDLRR